MPCMISLSVEIRPKQLSSKQTKWASISYDETKHMICVSNLHRTDTHHLGFF